MGRAKLDRGERLMGFGHRVLYAHLHRGRVVGRTAHCFEQRGLDRLIRPQSEYFGAEGPAVGAVGGEVATLGVGRKGMRMSKPPNMMNENATWKQATDSESRRHLDASNDPAIEQKCHYRAKIVFKPSTLGILYR